MKHGVIIPARLEQDTTRVSRLEGAIDWSRRNWRFFVIVVIPTLLVAGYYYLVAADQYRSEAHFIVKSGDRSSGSGVGIGAILGFGGSNAETAGDVASVADYLQSHDAVQGLQKHIDLLNVFRRAEADVFSKLQTADPAPETLLKYYRGKVSVHQDRDTGITDLTVNTFRPVDSYKMAQELLALGEQRVNQMNARSYGDSVSSARRQLSDAEDAVASIQRRMTSFRQGGSDIDPQSSSQSQIKLVSELNGKLAAARTQLLTMGAVISHSSPQYVAVSHLVQSLTQEVARQAGKLAGNSTAMARSLGEFEDLRVRQQYAGKSYEAAAANLQKAGDDARRQQLYIVRVVDANLPVKSLYPERTKIVATVFFTLLITYCIGWLISAGVREHTA